MELTKVTTTKDWKWMAEAKQAFSELKNRFTSALILVHFELQ